MILDQGIGRFLGRGKGFPKGIVNDHLCTSLPTVWNLCMRYDKRNFLLDYSRNDDYNEGKCKKPKKRQEVRDQYGYAMLFLWTEIREDRGYRL